MDALTFLREHVPLFRGLDEDHLMGLVGSAALKKYAAGQTVFFRGETVDGLHLVCAGQAGVFAKQPGRGLVQVAELGPGEVFGEVSIVEMGTAGATVKAGAEGAAVLVIPQEAFRRVLQQDEAFAVRVNTLIRERRSASSAQPA